MGACIQLLHDQSPPLTRGPWYRFPFLLVDRVVELEPQKYAVGYKHVTANDNFFTGHFPDRKIMPGECSQPLPLCTETVHLQPERECCRRAAG